MSEPMRELLLGYLLGALDDPEQDVVESRLQFDPLWRHELGELRKRLAKVDAVCPYYEPPAGLAQRTCEAIFSQPAVSAGRARDAMSPSAGPPVHAPALRLYDATAVCCIAVAAILLLMPAISSARFNAQVAACQDNLRELGMALTRYSENNNGYFPRVPTEGRLAVAGIYAPTLVRNGLLHEARKVICPASAMAGLPDFKLPPLEQLDRMSGQQLAETLPTLGGSYGYSLGHVEEGRYRDIRNERRPSFAIMADAPTFSLAGRSVNHLGYGENVLFEDGHVRFVTSSRPLGNDDIFSNDDGDIAAGLHSNDSVVVPSATTPLALPAPALNQ
jgi:hypothetical protein